MFRLIEQFGMADFIQTCKQRDNHYTRDNVYGLEVEMSTDLTVEEVYDATKYPWFILKYDSSICSARDYNMELVSVKGTLKALKIMSAETMPNLFDETEAQVNMTASGTATTGIHVHCCKKNFIDARHQRNFEWFFNNPQNFPFIYDLSERGALSEMGQYCRAPAIFETTTKLKAQSYRWKERLGRYAWVNTRNDHTVELRMFKMDTSVASIHKALETADAALEFTKERSATRCLWADFTEWLDKTQANQYPSLKEFIRIGIHEDSQTESDLWAATKTKVKTDAVFFIKEPSRTAITDRIRAAAGSIWPNRNKEYKLVSTPRDGGMEFKFTKRELYLKLHHLHEKTAAKYTRALQHLV
jgi:hypothetical protein